MKTQTSPPHAGARMTPSLPGASLQRPLVRAIVRWPRQMFALAHGDLHGRLALGRRTPEGGARRGPDAAALGGVRGERADVLSSVTQLSARRSASR